ncbi:MAG: hypothetical protein JWN06_374 [Propionibacteriaceae bacterium]|nr:hypothetical protein [Propionibacteriaceae bacterium]
MTSTHLCPDLYGRRGSSAELPAVCAVVLRYLVRSPCPRRACPNRRLFTDAADGELNGIIVPNWLSTDQVDERMKVWIAIGMLIARLPLSNDDALALLRGYAYSHNLTLAQVARQMTNHGLQPEALLV